MLARFENNPRFWAAVVQDNSWLKRQRAALHAAIVANSVDHTRADQWFWIEKALLLMGDQPVRRIPPPPAKGAPPRNAKRKSDPPEVESPTVTVGD